MNSPRVTKQSGSPRAAWKTKVVKPALQQSNSPGRTDDPLLAEITYRLAPVSDTPALDASVLLAHVLHKPRTWVMAHPELTLTEQQQEQLADSLTRLERGEPLPYVLGAWEFFGLEFDVNPHVLIPRPETELLVEKAIAWLQVNPSRRRIADIGTGSGAIAISIAANVPGSIVLATDISEHALQVAKRNAEKHRVSEQIEFTQCDILPRERSIVHRPSSLDLLCANLPYIPTETLQHLPIFEREPTLALDGGADGLDLYKKLFLLAPEWLAPHAKMLVEIECTRGAQTLEVANVSLPNAVMELHRDLAGRDRLLELTLGS